MLALSAPLYLILETTLWKPATIAIFFGYNAIYRDRCLGMRFAHTFIVPPTSWRFVSRYTAGFATFFYSVTFPFDLLLANTIAQLVSLKLTGNTLHGNLAGARTMTRDEYLERCKQRALEYLERGDVTSAIASMGSDLKRHDDFKKITEMLMPLGILYASNRDVAGARHWITGFR